MNHLRVIVTGSRDWWDEDKLWSTLWEVYNDHEADKMTIVHGGCPTGADDMAEQWAVLHAPEVASEVHKADWEEWGRAAGPIRNRKMVELGADLVLAFPLADSRGTYNCIEAAEAAGLEVRIIK